MVRLHRLILILLFARFQTDSASANKTSQEVSAIIQSYSDGFTAVTPHETQHTSIKIYPKSKYDTKPAFPNVPLVAGESNLETKGSNDFLSTSVEGSNAFKTIVPEKAQYDTYPKIENNGYVHEFTKAKYDNNPESSSEPLVVAGTNPEFIGYKDFSSASLEDSDESDEPRGPADHVIPYSEHENPREPSTRPNYTAPGVWAKPPAEKNIPLDFSPTKILAQVRDSHIVRHVPRAYAVESAETSEEKENAARLKEVVKESKANTIYTEEGYEDAAYDHAGHIRDADFQEDFARKLNEELERKAAYAGKKMRPKTYKKHKPRKHRHYNSNDFSENNKNHSDNEGKSSKLQLDKKNVQLLKSALGQPVINPKHAVERGISDLERDLRNEYRETQRTSTEPYAYVPTEAPTTFTSPVTESVFQSKMDLETTTMRRKVFTVRPKKLVVSVTPKPRRNNFKNRLKPFSVSQTIDNYNAFTPSSYEPTQLPTTANYGNLAWEYLLQNPNATVPVTYSPLHYEQQTINPLAVATVNGHGPYLLVATPETLTPSPAESQNLVNTVGYGLNDYNVTQPIIANPSIYHSPFIPVNKKNYRSNYESDPHAVHTHTVLSQPVKIMANENTKEELKHHHKNTKSNKIKSLSEGSPNYIGRVRDTYIDYYNAIKSPRTPNVPITFSHYKPPQSYRSFSEQWPGTFDNKKPGDSNGSDGTERLPIELKKQKGALTMTKLLPPAPLSASEYATFYKHNKGVKPIMSTVIEMMPIIDAIHKHEYEQNSFPFLFRRKRSTFGLLRTPNSKPIEGKHQEKNNNNADSSQSSSNPTKSNYVKYPANFHSLLNESPNVARKEVDAEIKKHFENDTKPSGESSYQSTEELRSNKNPKSSPGSKDNFKEGDIVEVQVPAVDFINVFEKDGIDPTTEKSRVNTKKYPFYKDSSALRNTALKYIVNPKEVPKKTLGGMEFYNSRVRECEEVNPDLEKIVPEDEELTNKRGPQKKKLRLQGLGDKIDCYKAKYFDETPFDNPLFIEKGVEMPPPPIELNPKEFASRILELPEEKEDYTISRGPKNPEFINVKRGLQMRRPLRHHVSGQNVRHHLHQKLRKPNLVNTSHQRYQYQPKNPIILEDEMKPPEFRSKMKTRTPNLKVVPRYQRLVYEDVMGNIMNSDKNKKSHFLKRGVTPLYSKNYKRDNNRQQGITGLKNVQTGTIGGLVPPPRKTADRITINKNRYNFTNVPMKNLRIHKRSVTSNEKGTSDSMDKKDKSTFRIVITTPLPNNTFDEKENVNPNEVNVTKAQNKYHSIIHSPKHTNRSEADRGRYGKFSTHRNSSLSYETRRKEPKYNVPESIFASSTFMPVMVKLYSNFTARIPRGNKNNQAKQQVTEELDDTEPTEKSEVPDENIDQPIKKGEEDPKKQFVTFKPVYGRTKTKPNEITTTTYASIPNIEKDISHKELAKFLKGNPPGYDKAFAEEIDTEVKKKEAYQVKDEDSDVNGNNEKNKNKNVDTEDEVSESETDDPEQKKETYGEDRISDDESEEVEENAEPGGEAEDDDVQDDKPFVRFSSRPESPPENYEDEHYADLGPRVNKPYFYHPPFDVPAYEKYGLGKSLDDSDTDEYGHEEAENSDTYVFPWEHDDEDDENKEESMHHSALGRHEYPWEKRERRDRERQKREKMRKKYEGKNFDSNYDSYGKASSMKLVYAPLKHKRGKKDVSALQSNPENRSLKFSSKYKSLKKTDLETDDENKYDIEKSILKYIENIDTSTPTDENIYASPEKKFKLVSDNVTSEALNKQTDRSVTDSNTPESSTTQNSSKRERAGRIISTTASPVNRPRGRIRKVNMHNNKTNSNETVVSSPTTLSIVQPTLSSKTTHQRGRNRTGTTVSTTATTTAKPNVRRRTRLTVTTTTTPTTSKPLNEKRRRSFRITSSAGSNAESTTPTNMPTSTGRTVERSHRSRVSKEMIITKTVEDNDGDDLDEGSDKKSKKSLSTVSQINRSKSRHRQQTKSTADGENPSKKERVEKVTITMEETPDHVYETKEIDKDGVKGKFITITANNNSVKAAPTKRSRDRTTDDDDAEMEEMQRRMEAFKSFDSVINDTEDLEDEPSSLRTADKYVVGSLFQNLPLPLTRKLTDDKEDKDDEDQSEYDDEVDDDDDDEEVENEDSGSEDLSDNKSDEETNRSNNSNSTEQNSSVIKNPNDRNYFYVETS